MNLRKIVAIKPVRTTGSFMHVLPGYFKILKKDAYPIQGLISNGFAMSVGILIVTPQAIGFGYSDTFDVASDTQRLLRKLKPNANEALTLVLAYNPFFKREGNPVHWKKEIGEFALKKNLNLSVFFYAVSGIFEKIAVTTSGQFLSLNGSFKDTQFPKISTELRLFDYVWDSKLKKYPKNTDFFRTISHQENPCFVMQVSRDPSKAEDRLNQKEWLSLLRIVPINSEQLIKAIPIAAIFWVGFLLGLYGLLEQLYSARTTSK